MTRDHTPNAGALSSIYNYRAVTSWMSTSGQLTLLELASVAAAGFSTIINLGVDYDSRFDFGTERAAVESLGLRYVYIPVAFSAPTEWDLLDFFAELDARRHEKLWIHCATNRRVSVFLCLYRIIRLGMEREHAFAQMLEVWAPNEAWSAFIAAMLAKYHGTAPGESLADSLHDQSGRPGIGAGTIYLGEDHASTQVRLRPVDRAEPRRLAAGIKSIAPHHRPVDGLRLRALRRR